MGVSRNVVRAMAVAAMFAAACSDGCGSEPLATPSGLAAAGVPDEFDLVALGWTAPRTWDDLEVQVRVGDGAWTSQPNRIPANAARLVLAFWPDLPELTTLGFRVRTIRGEETSPWSAEAIFLRGVRPAADLAISTRYDWRGRVLWLGWSRRSLVADRARLERQIRPTSGAAGPWVEVPLDAGATAYEDPGPTDWVDFARAAYRVTYWAGDLGSEPVEVVSDPGGVASPQDLSALLTGTNVHVAWVNASTAATRIDAWRWKAGVYDQREWTLAPTATSVDDPGLTPGLYQYAVQAVAETGSGYLSEPARIAVVVPAASHAASYPARAVDMPIGSGAARRTDGTFAIAEGTQNFGTYPSFVFAPRDGGWDRFSTPASTKLAVPGPLLDASGGVHAVYFEEVWSGATAAPVRHVWHDAAGWHVEYVGLGGWSMPSAAIAPDGSLHVAWGLPDGKGFAYATNAGGAFSVEEVRPAGGAAMTLATPLALDGGAPRILVSESYASPRRMWLVSRDGGSWSAEQIPGVAAPPDGGGNLLARGGTATWIYGQWNGDGYELWLRERAGGTWSAAEKLASTPTLPVAGAGVAQSPDGTRIAVALPGRDFSYPTAIARLVVREGGATTVTDLLPSQSGTQVGFTQEGKLWLLDGLALWAGNSGTGVYVLYEEP